MNDSNLQYIQINSGDYSCLSSDDASNFQNVLSVPIALDPERLYEVAVWDVMFTNYQDPSSTNIKSLYVNSNLVDETYIGSSLANVIMFIPWAQLITNVAYGGTTHFTGAPFGAGTQCFIETMMNRKWFPMVKMTSIKTVRISLTLSTGEFIPLNTSGGADFTSITLAIREVI